MRPMMRGSSKINTVAYNPAMKSRSKKGSKRRYIAARDVLADIPSPAIARKLTVKPLSALSGVKRLRAKAPASVRRKSAGVKADEPFLSLQEAGQLLHVSRTPHRRARNDGLPHKATAVIQGHAPSCRDHPSVITNQLQYLSTQAQATRFREALAAPERGLHPKAAKAMRDGLRSQLDDLEAELAEYERHGERP
jgi:hypothetical protein